MRVIFMGTPEFAVPALVAFGIFSVVAHWNDYFWPLIVVADQALYTPPLGVAFFRLNDQGTSYGPLMAAATISIAPAGVITRMLSRKSSMWV